MVWRHQRLAGGYVVLFQGKPDGTIHLTQPHLIDQILQDLRLAATKDTPAKVGVTLQQYPDSQPFDGHFIYRSVIGKINYLEKSTQPEIAYAVHRVQGCRQTPGSNMPMDSNLKIHNQRFIAKYLKTKVEHWKRSMFTSYDHKLNI
jgi:hypothetical protein